MTKRLAALLIAVALPGTASAWSWGEAPDASVDVYAIPKVTVDVGGKEFGDGYGLRGQFRAYQMVSVLVEHNRLQPDAGTGVSQTRLGVGVTLPSGTGLFLEYADDRDSDSSNSGYGVRGRVTGQARPDVRLYADLGYLKYQKEFGFKPTELFYSAGGTFSINEMFGLFADYKVSTYKFEGIPIEPKVSMARLGMNIAFGF